MPTTRALWIILTIGIAGLAFSGYLTFEEFFVADTTAACSPLGQPGTMFGYPPCVYGFVMYLAIVAVAALGLRGGKQRAEPPRSLARPIHIA